MAWWPKRGGQLVSIGSAVVVGSLFVLAGPMFHQVNTAMRTNNHATHPVR